MFKNLLKNLWKIILNEEIEKARIEIRKQITEEVDSLNKGVEELYGNIRLVKYEIQKLLVNGSEIHTFLGFPSRAGLVESIKIQTGQWVYKEMCKQSEEIARKSIEDLGINSEEFIDRVIDRIKRKQL